MKMKAYRMHVGEFFDESSNELVCVIPLGQHKQFSRIIQERSDVPNNWAVCRGSRPAVSAAAPNVQQFSCREFYSAIVGNEYAQAEAVTGRPLDKSGAGVLAESFEKTELVQCVLDWASAALAFELTHVARDDIKLAIQATKDALQQWAPLEDDQANPLSQFDDDSDLRHLTFVRVVQQCCAAQTAQASTQALWTLVCGNIWLVVYIVLLGPALRRQHNKTALGVFVAWLATMLFVLRRIAVAV